MIHKFSSILSAYGQALADIVHEIQEPAASELSDQTVNELKATSLRLISAGKSEMISKGFSNDRIAIELYWNLRYNGTDTAIMTLRPDENNDWDFTRVFLKNYEKEFGFSLPGRSIIVDDIRVRCTGKSIATGSDSRWTNVHNELRNFQETHERKSETSVSAYWDGAGRIRTPLFLLKNLKVGDKVLGPALIIDDTVTIAVEPFCHVIITLEHVVGFVGEKSKEELGSQIVCDPILLSVFGHRFMSIAEQMGRTLQKTSISTNMKERLDFSCALFGPDGGLVANAPHIPVHLVRYFFSSLGLYARSSSMADAE